MISFFRKDAYYSHGKHWIQELYVQQTRASDLKVIATCEIMSPEHYDYFELWHSHFTGSMKQVLFGN